MRPHIVTLTKDGFFSVKFDAQVEDFTSEAFELDLHNLLWAWNAPLEIKDGITLNTVFGLVRRLDQPTMDALELLTDSEISSFIHESALLRPVLNDKNLLYVDVHKNLNLNNFANLGDKFELVEYVTTAAIGEPAAGEVEPREYSLSMLPLYEIRNLPLVLNRKTPLVETTWKQLAEKEVLVRDDNGNPLVTAEKDIDEENMYTVDAQITLGEFLDSLFGELCIYGDPEGRNEFRISLEGVLGDGQPSDE